MENDQCFLVDVAEEVSIIESSNVCKKTADSQSPIPNKELKTSQMKGKEMNLEDSLFCLRMKTMKK